MKIRIDFFQNFVPVLDDKPVKMPFAKAEGMLYCLIVEKRISKEALADLFWGDCAEELAKKSLRNAIYTLRRLFGEHIIVAVGKNFLELGADYQVDGDLDYFREDYQADSPQLIRDYLHFYQQNFLSSFLIKNAMRFADWQYFNQEKYRKIYLKGLEQCVAVAEKLGEKELVEEILQKLISLECYEERYYLQLIRHLMQDNQVAACLKLYARLENLLKQDLLIQPSAEIRDLIDTIIKEQLVTNKESKFFFGRQQELLMLKKNFFSFIKENPSQSVVIVGEAGVGKSCLIDNFVSSLHENFILLDITNYKIEKSFSYKLWDNIFEQLQYLIPKYNLKIPDGLINAIKNAFPTYANLNHIFDVVDHSGVSTAENYMLQLLVIICQQVKVMMVVDDLQWVDSSSLDLLLKVLVRCDNLLMVAAARDNQQTLLDYLSAALQQPKQILQINLHRFTASETTEFISSQVPEFACYGDVIYRESEGNPFFIAEMIRNLQAGIDINLLNQHMNDFIGSRVVGLSNSTKAIANMCAAIQGDISLELLSAVSGLRNIELVDLIEELLDKKILMEFRNIRGDIEFFFTHQKIREYIYNHISLSKRQIIHEKIAQGLENIFVRDQGNQTYYPRLIYHYTVSGNTYKMLYYRLKHLELILKPRHEIFPINPESTDIAITSYLHPEKDIDEELAELDGLLKHGHLHCNEEELNRLKMSYCFIYGRYNREKGNYQVGKLSLLRMLELARQAEDQHYLAEGYTQLILHAVDVYDLEMLESMIAEAAKVKYIQDSPDYAGNMLRLQGYLEIYREHYQLGEQLIHQAIAILEPVAEVKGWYFQLAAAYFCLGESRLRQGDTKGAEQHLLTAKEYCYDSGLNASISVVDLLLGMVYYREYDYSRALVLLEQSFSCYREHFFIWYRSLLCCYLAKTYLRLDRIAEAREYAEYSLTISTRLNNSYERKELDSLLAELEQRGIYINKY